MRRGGYRNLANQYSEQQATGTGANIHRISGCLLKFSLDATEIEDLSAERYREVQQRLNYKPHWCWLLAPVV
jgi:hypothetical protein